MTATIGSSFESTISTAAIAPVKRRDRADRQVDVADDDDQEHAQGHHDDVAVLQEDVRDVQRT